MAVKSPGRRKFTQFMADHVFGHKDRNEFLSVVYRKGLSDQFRGNGGTARPGFDDRFAPRGFLPSDLFQKAFLYVCTLLN